MLLAPVKGGLLCTFGPVVVVVVVVGVLLLVVTPGLLLFNFCARLVGFRGTGGLFLLESVHRNRNDVRERT